MNVAFTKWRWVLCCALVLIFCRYLLYQLPNYGLHDWDQHLFYYGSFFKSMVDYQQIPFWNPWYCGGTVLWQNPQVPIVSPVYVLSFFMPLHVAMKINIILHYLIALIGMILVGHRIFKIGSFFLCLIGASFFVFNSFFALQITEGHTWIFSFAYLPYAFYFFHQSLFFPKIRNIIFCAAMLALIVFAAGIYPLFFLLIFWGMYVVIVFIKRPSWLLFRTCLLVGVFAFGFSSIKLLPVMAFAKTYPRISVHDEHVSFRNLPRVFLQRDQSVRQKLPGQFWRWHEYGCFLGIGLSVLLIMSFFYCLYVFTPLSLLSASSLILFLVIFLGRFSEYAPYALFDILPLAKSLRVPGRALIIWTLSASFCAFFLLKFLEKKIWTRNIYLKWIVSLVLLVSLVDLLYVNSKAFNDAFTISSAQVESFAPKKTPNEFDVVYKLKSYGSMSAMYKGLQRNIATFDCYEPQEPNKGYRMDRLLVFGESQVVTVSNIRFSPQKIVFHAELTKDAPVYLNQNYVRGWKVHLKNTPVVEKNHLPMITLKKGSYRDIEFQFIPEYGIMSLIIFVLTCLSGGVWIFGRKKIRSSY